MYSDHFWLCLEGLAIALDGSPQNGDGILAEYESVWLKWTKTKRAEIRTQLVNAISALAHLETRLSEHDRIQ
jgi:hypothetical protein